MKMSAVKNFTFQVGMRYLYANFPTKCPYRFINKFNYGDVQMANVKDCSSLCFRSNRPGKDKLDGLVNTFKTAG